jgi:hypothetical protein
MRTWSFYLLETGAFTGRTYSSTDPDTLARNTPPDCVAIEGTFDPRTQRFDSRAGMVEHWRPAPPSDDHEWIDGAWRLSAAAIRRRTLAQIRAIESQQLRPLRELAVDPDNPIARERLTSLDAQIAALRELL